MLRLCIEADEALPYIKQAHVAVGNIHLSPVQTIRRVQLMGVYWPTLQKYIYNHIHDCTCKMGKARFKHASTLF